MKTLILFLLCGPCMAQTYDLNLQLDGMTYQGQFTYVPTYNQTPGGQTVELGYYTNVAISDPYGGMLTSVFDPYDGNNLGQHELWFTNAANTPAGTIGINIPDTGVQGSSVPVTGALVYTGTGSMDYVTCSPCDASITEAFTANIRQAPELDPASGIAATTLLGCIVLILKSGRSSPRS